MCEGLVRRDEEFDQLDEAFNAYKDRTTEWEFSLSTAASAKAVLCSQATIPQTDHAIVRVDLSTVPFSETSATLELSRLRKDDKRLESRVSQLSSMVDDMRLQPAIAKFFIFFAIFKSLRGERDRC